MELDRPLSGSEPDRAYGVLRAAGFVVDQAMLVGKTPREICWLITAGSARARKLALELLDAVIDADAA